MHTLAPEAQEIRGSGKDLAPGMVARCPSRPADFFRRIVKRRDMVAGDGIRALGRAQLPAERAIRPAAKSRKIPRGPGGVTLGAGPAPVGYGSGPARRDLRIT